MVLLENVHLRFFFERMRNADQLETQNSRPKMVCDLQRKQTSC